MRTGSRSSWRHFHALTGFLISALVLFLLVTGLPWAKVWLDASTGAVLKRENFQDRHVLDRMVGIGVAAHEGQLFGWPNVVLGVFAAGGLFMLVTSGILMWWRRRPSGILVAPHCFQTRLFRSGVKYWSCFSVCIYLCFQLPYLSMLLIEKFDPASMPSACPLAWA